MLHKGNISMLHFGLIIYIYTTVQKFGVGKICFKCF